MATRMLAVRLASETDVVVARRRASQIAAALDFDTLAQTRIATTVSELARNAYQYAGSGTVEFALAGHQPPQVLVVTVSDHGRGIADVDGVLSGSYRSATGMGLGLAGSRRLMDQFTLTTGPSGTVVTIGKLLPARAALVTPARLAQISHQLAQAAPANALEELQQRNQELLQTLDLLRMRQDELERVNRELEDTNRGVVALYAELDERADHLRRADEVKTRFLSNMTHEFRTPVNSILALTRLLAERLGTPADERDEVFYIRRSAQQLSDIVDDLLDLAKVEAGKIDIHPATFDVYSLFSALRGMLRPLLASQSVTLIFEPAADLPPLISDESKLSQILRNLISNALKYTERGEVRVSAALTPARDAVAFSVSDTGIGIPEHEQSRIFDEFVQIENPLQRRTKGTGLGLPLSKRLAELLGGTLSLSSTLGVGSTFVATIPLILGNRSQRFDARLPALEVDRHPVLVIEDRDEDVLIYERMLAGSAYQPFVARNAELAEATLQAIRPAAIILDINLYGIDSWDLLARLRRDGRLTDVPIVVVSTVDDPQKAFALGADACQVKPVSGEWLLSTLEALCSDRPARRVLIVDDEETFRFIARSMLSGLGYDVFEATAGAEGLELTRTLQPDVALVDFQLGDMTAEEFCAALPASASEVAVVVVSSQSINGDALQRMGARHFLAKSDVSHDRLRAVLEMVNAAPSAATGERS